jgi:hypothetical protein
MDDETQSQQHLKIVPPKELKYQPSRLDIMDFGVLYQDETFWRAWCQMASDMNTTVSALWNTVQAHVLSQAGYWDPRNPKGPPLKVHVTVRDIQNNPKAMDPPASEVLNTDGPDLLDFLDDN